MRPQATAAGNARMRYGKQPCEEMQEAEDSNMLCLFRRGRVGPIPEVQVFCNSGQRMSHNRTAASFADRLLAHTQQAFAHTPKKQKNNNTCNIR